MLGSPNTKIKGVLYCYEKSLDYNKNENLPQRAFLRSMNTMTSQLDRIPGVKKKKFRVSCDGLKTPIQGMVHTAL